MIHRQVSEIYGYFPVSDEFLSYIQYFLSVLTFLHNFMQNIRTFSALWPIATFDKLFRVKTLNIFFVFRRLPDVMRIFIGVRVKKNRKKNDNICFRRVEIELFAKLFTLITPYE